MITKAAIVLLHGYEKVALLDLDGRSQDVYHALSKRPLEATTIFLFNISKDCQDQDSSYRVLESIKDGRALTKKYETKMIHFKTPNILMVFSNCPPDLRRLSRDRWHVYEITTDGELGVVTGDRMVMMNESGKMRLKKKTGD